MARNIHQSKRLKTNKPAASAKPATAAAAIQQPVAATVAPVKASAAKVAASHQTEAHIAALPYELRQIAFFAAFVVVLLLVLWFFLK